jgi:hypothetical protein
LIDETRFSRGKTFLSATQYRIVQVANLSLKLKVDGKEIPLNEFVGRMLSGTITGGVTSLKGIKEDWKRIEVEIQK